MTLRTLFEKQVFIRLDDTHTAVVCTTKWALLSRMKRFGVGKCGQDFDAQVTEPGAMAREESRGTRQAAE